MTAVQVSDRVCTVFFMKSSSVAVSHFTMVSGGMALADIIERINPLYLSIPFCESGFKMAPIE